MKNNSINEQKVQFPTSEADDYPLNNDERLLIQKIKFLNNTVRETILRNNFRIGTAFLEQYKSSYGEDTVGMIAEKVEMSKSTLYTCIRDAKKFTENDIELFCTGGAFVLSQKWVKEFMSLGRDAIIETFKNSVSLKDFKEKMTALKLEQKQQAPDGSSDDPGEGCSNTDTETTQTPENSEGDLSNFFPGEKFQKQSKQDTNPEASDDVKDPNPNGDSGAGSGHTDDTTITPPGDGGNCSTESNKHDGNSKGNANPVEGATKSITSRSELIEQNDPGGDKTGTNNSDEGDSDSGNPKEDTTETDSLTEVDEHEGGTTKTRDSDEGKTDTNNPDEGDTEEEIDDSNFADDESSNLGNSKKQSKTDEIKRNAAAPNVLPKVDNGSGKSLNDRVKKTSSSNRNDEDLSKVAEHLKGLKEENEKLQQQVEGLKRKNLELKKENQTLQQKIKDLESSAEDDYDETDLSMKNEELSLTIA